MDISSSVETVLICFFPAVLGILLHEIAHGYVAYRLGDPTAKILGRLTLNPLPHIDPLGLLVFVVTSLTSPFVFGWAKPVPIDPRYFRSPMKGLMYVAFAGPLMNFSLALFFALLLWVAVTCVSLDYWLVHSWAIPLLQSCKVGVYINLGLAWLNLIPIPPLDGSRIVAYFLPPQHARTYLQIERYGFLILLLLIMTGMLNSIIKPLIFGCADALLAFL